MGQVLLLRTITARHLPGAVLVILQLTHSVKGLTLTLAVMKLRFVLVATVTQQQCMLPMSLCS